MNTTRVVQSVCISRHDVYTPSCPDQYLFCIHVHQCSDCENWATICTNHAIDRTLGRPIARTLGTVTKPSHRPIQPLWVRSSSITPSCTYLCKNILTRTIRCEKAQDGIHITSCKYRSLYKAKYSGSKDDYCVGAP